jgi:hypothetical protein
MEHSADVLTANWKAYADAYAATDEQERNALLQACVSDDVEFTNPGGEGRGRATLSAHIAKVQQSMHGAYFRTEKTYVHHGELLAVWALCKQDDTKIAAGYNFVRPGADGRFDYMAGFF